MPRGSNPPPPAQWNLHGWLAAYYEAQGHPTTPMKKKEDSMDKMTGGWQYEGKEPPPPIRICPKCQGAPFRREISEEPDISLWCEDCQEGKPGPGAKPKHVK